MLAQSDFTLTRAGMLGWSLASLCLGFPSVKWDEREIAHLLEVLGGERVLRIVPGV